MPIRATHFNSNRTGYAVVRSMHNSSVCLVISMYGCDLACDVKPCRGLVSPSSRFRSLGHIVNTVNNGTHEMGIVVPCLCRDHRGVHDNERSLSYTATLRRLMDVNIRGVVAFSTRSTHIRGTAPLRKFRAVRPSCRFVGTLLGRRGKLRVSGSRFVVVDPSRKDVGHTVCLTGVLNISVNVCCGHLSCSGEVGKHRPVTTCRFLNPGLGNGSVVLVSSVVSSNSAILGVSSLLGREKTNEVCVYSAFKLFAGKLRGFSRTRGTKIFSGLLAAGLVCRSPRLLTGSCCVSYSVDGCVTLVVSALGRSRSMDCLLGPISEVGHYMDGCVTRCSRGWVASMGFVGESFVFYSNYFVQGSYDA